MTEPIPCPFCDGEISTTAKKCRHCGEWVRGQCARCGASVRGRWAAQSLCAQCEEVAVAEAPSQAIQQMDSGGRGSGGNVVAALVSVFIPGLGQLIQGRFFSAVFIFGFSTGLVDVLPWLDRSHHRGSRRGHV